MLAPMFRQSHWTLEESCPRTARGEALITSTPTSPWHHLQTFKLLQRRIYALKCCHWKWCRGVSQKKNNGAIIKRGGCWIAGIIDFSIWMSCLHIIQINTLPVLVFFCDETLFKLKGFPLTQSFRCFCTWSLVHFLGTEMRPSRSKGKEQKGLGPIS